MKKEYDRSKTLKELSLLVKQYVSSGFRISRCQGRIKKVKLLLGEMLVRENGERSQGGLGSFQVASMSPCKEGKN
jgi:hypothetical protein